MVINNPISRRGVLGGLVAVVAAASVTQLAQAAINPEEFTIGHKVLDVEAKYYRETQGITHLEGYEILDSLIHQAKNRIDKKTGYNEQEALHISSSIDRLLTDNELDFNRDNILLNEGLRTGNIACDNYVMIFLSIADALNLPLNAVLASKHTFIRFKLDDTNYINWEKTGRETGQRSDKYLIDKYSIHKAAIKRGTHMRSLNPEEALAIEYVAVGLEWYKRDLNKAIVHWDKAIELNPKMALAYANKGYALAELRELDKAFSNFQNASFLDPGNKRWSYNAQRIKSKLKS